MEVKAGMPTAKCFDGLSAETNYAVYIGGCRGQQTLLDYGSFTTLPKAESPTDVSPRILLSHGGRVDRITPGKLCAPSLSLPLSYI